MSIERKAHSIKKVGWVICGLVSFACHRKNYDEAPEIVVRDFIERMENFQGDVKTTRATFNLLSQASQTNLSERAHRASSALGTQIGPERMLAPFHFYPRFQPRQWTTRKIGNRAIVEITGVDPTNEHAAVPCIFEGSEWRIDLELPALPAFQRRKTTERDE